MKLNQILFSINFPDSILLVSLKGYSTPKFKLSLFTYPHAVPTP